jgi:hypothetical protein
MGRDRGPVFDHFEAEARPLDTGPAFDQCGEKTRAGYLTSVEHSHAAV